MCGGASRCKVHALACYGCPLAVYVALLVVYSTAVVLYARRKRKNYQKQSRIASKTSTTTLCHFFPCRDVLFIVHLTSLRQAYEYNYHSHRRQ